MKNENWYKINSESRAIDILRDRNFLRLLRVLVLEFEPNIKDKNLENLKEQFKSKKFLSDFNKKNDDNLFNQIITFLNDDFVKTIFFEYLQNYNIDQKYLNLFLETGDFLEKVFVDSKEYPEWFYNASDKYKTKITDILWKNELTDPKYKLLEIWYPLISPFSSAIVDVDIENSFTKKSILWWEDIYIYCRDERNNIFYMNYLWELLKDANGKIIKDIDYKGIKTFAWFKVFKFTNEDNQTKIWIISEIWIWNINELEDENFSVNKFSYIEDVLAENGIDINDKQEDLELLYIQQKEENYYLDKNLSKVSLLDIFDFINKNNPLLLDNIKKTLDKFSEIDVKKIYKIYNFSWLKFIELEVETERYIDEYWDTDYEINHCVMLENWKAIVDKHEFWNAYIRSLWEKANLLDYEFVSFKLTNFSDVDWYIDSFGNVIKIDGKRLISLDKIFSHNWEEYYRLNGDAINLYKKSFIKKQLSKYSSFKEVWSIFDIVMEWN